MHRFYIVAAYRSTLCHDNFSLNNSKNEVRFKKRIGPKLRKMIGRHYYELRLLRGV